MKIRCAKGFVTNSSSSSFVVLVKGIESEQIVHTESELKEFLNKFYGEDVIEGEWPKWYKKQYDSFLEYINNGYGLLECQISNENYINDFKKTIDKLGLKMVSMET